MYSDRETVSTSSSRREILKRAAVGSTVVAFGLPALTATAAADQPQRDSLVGTVIPNPCTGEDMVVTKGRSLFDLDTRPDGSGGVHITLHFNTQGAETEGTESGRTYLLNGAAAFSQNVKPPFPVIVTDTVNVRVISQGSADNQLIKGRMHFTVNANGDVTVDRMEGTAECV
ncbi:hypothetical protein [Haladaptatus sp. NG-SE-30]